MNRLGSAASDRLRTADPTPCGWCSVACPQATEATLRRFMGSHHPLLRMHWGHELSARPAAMRRLRTADSTSCVWCSVACPQAKGAHAAKVHGEGFCANHRRGPMFFPH